MSDLTGMAGMPDPTTRDALASEWIKLRTVRSTYLTTLIAALAALFVGTLDSASAAHDWDTWSPQRKAAFDPVRYGFSGAFYIVVLAIGTLGVLAASSEYGTGLIRTTFTATPRRSRVLMAKILTVGGLALLIGEALAFATFFLSQAQLSGRHLSVGLGNRGALRAVLDTGLFVAVFALVGLGIGVVVRRTAGAVALLFGLFFILPGLLEAISDNAGKWALQSVFESVTATIPATTATRPTPGTGLAICAIHLSVALGTAAFLVNKRDV